MNTGKSFCVSCETIQGQNTRCIKCQSKNIFYVGKDARFPKNPKKNDYFHFFDILLTVMERCAEDTAVAIHKWITKHKYRNHINPHLEGGLSYGERAEALLLNAQKRELAGQQKVNESSVKDGWSIMSSSEIKIIHELVKNSSQGYAVPALSIILAGNNYDRVSKINPFQPRIISNGTHIIFKNSTCASAISSTLAQNFLDSEISKDHPELSEYAKVYAKKKRNLLSEYPEYFI